LIIIIAELGGYKGIVNLFLGKNFRGIRQFLWKALALFSDKIKIFYWCSEQKGGVRG